MTFDGVFAKWNWTLIRNCPGRFTFSGGTSALTPVEIAGTDLPVFEFEVENVPDRVLVMKFSGGGGLISYRKGNDRFLHTLNDADGFSRKLEQLQIALF